MNIIIRNETPADYRAVEILTRNSFWNVYKYIIFLRFSYSN